MVSKEGKSTAQFGLFGFLPFDPLFTRSFVGTGAILAQTKGLVFPMYSLQ